MKSPKLSRREFIKTSLIAAGCVILPIKLAKAKPLINLNQFHVIFEVPASEKKMSKAKYTARYLKPALHALNNMQREKKRKGYRSCPVPKNYKCDYPYINVEYFRYKDMYIRYVTKFYVAEHDIYCDRLDMFMKG